MSVTFTATTTTVGWRSGCPYDATIYPDYESAAEARADHPRGGCFDARRFVQPQHLSDGDWEAWMAAYDAEQDRLENWPDWCVDDCFAPVAVADVEAPSVNLSNGNAAELLRVLGYVTDDRAGLDRASPLVSDPLSPPDTIPWMGSASPDEFLGRVLTALAVAPSDPGLPSYEDTREGSATVVFCGRRAGYLDEKLHQLHELADWAAAHGRSIVWD